MVSHTSESAPASGRATGPAAPGRTEGAPRDCGGCNICCTVMRVAALDKPAGVRCAHQTDQGCGIYQSRPDPCRAWFCMWVRDDGRIMSERHRPDRLGVFFTASAPDPKTGRQTIFCHECFDGAAEQPEVRRLLAAFERAVPVQVLRFRPAGQPTIPLTHEGRDVPAPKPRSAAQAPASRRSS